VNGSERERMGSSLKASCCAARTRSGKPCRSSPVTGRTRCRMHGGASTGPRAAEGKKRVGDATRRRYVAAAIADGWVILEPTVRAAVVRLMDSLNGSRFGTANALGITVSGLRRVLNGLPSRPDEFSIITNRLRGPGPSLGLLI